MELNRLQKLAGLPLTEAVKPVEAPAAEVEQLDEAKSKLIKLEPVETQQFKGSDEFESAFSNASVAVEHAVAVLNSLAMKHWMRESVSNYGFKMNTYTTTVQAADKLKEKMDALYDALSELG